MISRRTVSLSLGFRPQEGAEERIPPRNREEARRVAIGSVGQVSQLPEHLPSPDVFGEDGPRPDLGPDEGAPATDLPVRHAGPKAPRSAGAKPRSASRGTAASAGARSSSSASAGSRSRAAGAKAAGGSDAEAVRETTIP